MEYALYCKRNGDKQQGFRSRESKSERKVFIMKNYKRTMVENYFVKNLVALGNVGKKDNSAEVLRRNSYTMLNVSPRFF